MTAQELRQKIDKEREQIQTLKTYGLSVMGAESYSQTITAMRESLAILEAQSEEMEEEETEPDSLCGSDPYERLWQRLINKEITHERYTELLDAQNERDEQAVFFLSVRC